MISSWHLTQGHLLRPDKGESSDFSPPHSHIVSPSTSIPSHPQACLTPLQHFFWLLPLSASLSPLQTTCPAVTMPPYSPFWEIKDGKCVDMDIQEYIFYSHRKGRGWKEGFSTSRTKVIVENSVNRNRKVLFLRNSSKTVVTWTTFQKTVRPNVITGCESFTKCWDLGRLFHVIL